MHKFQSEIIEYNNNKIKNHFGNNDIFILFKEIDVLTDEELEQIDWAIQRAKLKRKK